MAALGYTLNMITMLALTLMVGIVIDDAIVVLENIYRFVEEKGMPRFRRRSRARARSVWPSWRRRSRCSRCFIPVGFMGGIVGRFMSSFGLTASFAAIAVSLIVSFTLTPMLAARWIKPPKESVSPLLADESRVVAGAPERQEHTEGREEPEVAGDDAMRTPGAQRLRRRSDGDARRSERARAEVREEKAHFSKGGRFYRPIDRAYTAMLKWSMAHRWVIVGSVRAGHPEHRAALHVRRQKLPAGGRPIAVRDQHARAGRLDARGHFDDARTHRARRARAAGRHRHARHHRRRPAATRQQREHLREARAASASANCRRRVDGRRANCCKKYPPELRTNIGQVQAISGGGQRNADVQYMIAGPDLQKLDEVFRRTARIKMTTTIPTPTDSSLMSGQAGTAHHHRPRARQTSACASATSRRL
jgi:HAE1 family hydrophobic/amphiphilic exporter-1